MNVGTGLTQFPTPWPVKHQTAVQTWKSEWMSTWVVERVQMMEVQREWIGDKWLKMRMRKNHKIGSSVETSALDSDL